MFLGIAAIVLVLIVWFCFSAGLILLGTAGLIAYFITRAVFRRKGKAKPKAVWFILPTIVLGAGRNFLTRNACAVSRFNGWIKQARSCGYTEIDKKPARELNPAPVLLSLFCFICRSCGGKPGDFI